MARAFAQAATSDVVLVAAPSGFGKTVALDQHLATLPGSGVRVAIRRESSEADLLRDLLASLHGTDARGDGLAAAALAATQIEDRWLAIRWLEDRLARRQLAWIALDDTTRLTPSARRFLGDLIERVSACRWYVVARDENDVATAGLAAAGRLAPPLGASVLAFDVPETRALAERLNVALDAEQALALHRATEGWPVALALALQHPAGPLDPRGVPIRARELLARYVDQRVLTELDADESDVLGWTPYFATPDVALLERVGCERAAAALDLLARRTPLVRRNGGTYVVHDLLVDGIARRENERGRAERNRRWVAAGDACRAHGLDGEALAAYARADAPVAFAALLAERGEHLVEQGYSEEVDRALSRLTRARRDADARLLLLEALVLSDRGRFELAERLLRAAAADRTARPVASVRLSTLLVNRGKAGASDVLAPLAAARATDVEVQSAYAVALAAEGRVEEGRATVERALPLVRRTRDLMRAARSWQRLGLASYYLGQLDRTRDCCRKALELAEREGFAGVLTRTHSLLYAVASADGDDEAAAAEARAMVRAARAGGLRQLELSGLSALLVDAAERGDERAFAEADAEFAGLGPVRGHSDAYLYAFAKALDDLRRGALAAGIERFRRIVRDGVEPKPVLAAAEAVSLLFLFRLDRDATRKALVDARPAWRRLAFDPRHSAARSAVLTFAAIAALEAALGQSAYAARAARQARAAAKTARERALARAAVALASATTPRANRDALDPLRERGLHGYARLFDLSDALAAAEPAVLSELELELLRAYCARRSAKQIADASGRNVHTVRTHIRNVSRKLGASGRDELIALAIERGLVET